MSSIALRVVLHGLIALAPDSSSHATKVTALLVNATNPPSMECMKIHSPVISFAATKEQCDAVGTSAGCANDHTGACTCNNLLGREITLEISPPPSPPGIQLHTTPPEALPNSSEAGDFAYALNLAQPPFGLTLDPQYLGANANVANLAARMVIPIDLLTTCRYVLRQDAEDFNIHALAARKVGNLGKNNELIQAAARLVEAKIDLPQNVFKVALHFHKFDGSDDHPANLLVTGSEFRIELSNEQEGFGVDVPCDDGVARHFDMFYLLALPTAAPHLVPHLRLTKFEPASAAPTPSAPACEPPQAAAAQRPICALASFAP
jgi:hypothetical protein